MVVKEKQIEISPGATIPVSWYLALVKFQYLDTKVDTKEKESPIERIVNQIGYLSLETIIPLVTQDTYTPTLMDVGYKLLNPEENINFYYCS
ncbi:MAG: hypothetical protein V1831_00895 [Candidatus Woesearchaeota archaeon]